MRPALYERWRSQAYNYGRGTVVKPSLTTSNSNPVKKLHVYSVDGWDVVISGSAGLGAAGGGAGVGPGAGPSAGPSGGHTLGPV